MGRCACVTHWSREGHRKKTRCCNSTVSLQRERKYLRLRRGLKYLSVPVCGLGVSTRNPHTWTSNMNYYREITRRQVPIGGEISRTTRSSQSATNQKTGCRVRIRGVVNSECACWQQRLLERFQYIL